MKQHTKLQSVFYHLYPGVGITLFFIIAAPYFSSIGLPPQLAMLVAIVLIVVPIIWLHLLKAKRNEKAAKIRDLIVYNKKLPTGKLILYVAGLILFAFIIYGLTQPLNTIISDKLFYWLPDWYQVRDFAGYSRNIILITLILNLVLNGFLAPIAEEIYFRGYLLPRMQNWAKMAPIVNAVLFSLYHFWQPQIYLTLIIALVPLSYFTWKTQSLKLAVYTHCGLNIFGAILSFAMLGN
jgi:membrane protease YdiL (CAAX protease family)